MSSINGTVRLGLRTKKLVRRLGPDDIAVIKHRDIDLISAEELVDTGVKAVINNAVSSTGRYPNAGPLVLLNAGVQLVDVEGVDLFELLKDGQLLQIEEGRLSSNGDQFAVGTALNHESLVEQQERSRREISRALAEFADNTVTHIREEAGLLAGDFELPVIDTVFRDRHALIVVRGPSYKRDLRALRPYIRDLKPVLVGVDGGGEALMEVGLQPDLIVGDMDSANDDALKAASELVVHAYSDGSAPGEERLLGLGLDYKVAPITGTSQDVAMLLAYEKGATLIVSVGSHFNLIEFLDKDRSGMSSTFLTRLRIGELLVDAKGVSRLYRSSPGRGQLLALLLAALITVVVVVLVSPPLERLAELLWLKIRILLGL